MRHFKHLNRYDRIKMETMLNSGHSVKEIAEYLGVHVSTIYREKKRGAYVHRNSNWTETVSYSSDLGQKNHDVSVSHAGPGLKIGNDIAYANYLEDMIVNHKYSPEAALFAAAKNGFKTHICINTLYNYIGAGIFLRLSNKDLPIKGRRVKHKRKVKVAKRASAGTSIEKRPEEINKRNTFGHWEMDTVKGKKKVTKGCLLVLTERKTRDEIIVKLRDQKDESVVEAIDVLERKWGSMFSQVFRSITVDNGVEFADCAGLERSCLYEGQRTFVFYCHPYSSWERGSNENQNKLIRRHIAKGEDIDQRNDEEIQYIENWINQYPRGIMNGKTAAELFEKELRKMA